MDFPTGRLPEPSFLNRFYYQELLKHAFREYERYEGKTIGILDYSVVDRIVKDIVSGRSASEVCLDDLVINGRLDAVRQESPLFASRDHLFFLENLYLAKMRKQQTEPIKVLEVGAGVARYGLPFVDPLEFPHGYYYGNDPHKRLKRIYTATDHDLLLFRIAREVYRTALEEFTGRLFIEQQDVTNLTYDDDTFDIVVSKDMLHHVDDLEIAINQMIRVTKPTGLIVIRDFKRDNIMRVQSEHSPYYIPNWQLYLWGYEHLQEGKLPLDLTLDINELLSIASLFAAHTSHEIANAFKKADIPEQNIRLNNANNSLTLVAQKPPATDELRCVRFVEDSEFL